MEHEVVGEAFQVAFYRLYQPTGFHAVERRQIGIEQYLVSAQQQDADAMASTATVAVVTLLICG